MEELKGILEQWEADHQAKIRAIAAASQAGAVIEQGPTAARLYDWCAQTLGRCLEVARGDNEKPIPPSP